MGSKKDHGRRWFLAHDGEGYVLHIQDVGEVQISDDLGQAIYYGVRKLLERKLADSRAYVARRLGRPINPTKQTLCEECRAKLCSRCQLHMASVVLPDPNRRHLCLACACDVVMENKPIEGGGKKKCESS